MIAHGRLPSLLASVTVAVSALAGAGGSGAKAGEVPIGPRAIAMGNAYTAVANDATAIFWNPAGIPQIGNEEIAATHADLFGSGVKDDYLAFVLPFSPTIAFAADWYHSGFDDGELNFGDNRLDVAWGMKLFNRLSVGLNGKYLTRNTELDQASVRQGHALGLDAGVIASPMERLRLGGSLQNLFDTKIHYADGNGSSVIYPRNLRFGASYQPIQNGLLAIDVDHRLHAGVEYQPIDLLAVRAGLESDLDGSGESPTYSTGLGVKAGIFRFDYALSVHPTLGETSHFGLALEFNFNPAEVRIEKVEAQDVYASLQKAYARDAFGTIRLRNTQKRPISAVVTVFAPELMDRPTEQEVLLRPKAVQEVPLTAVLSDKVVARGGDRRVQLAVGVNYRGHRLSRTERRSTQLVAYGPGAVQWGQGVAQAAAFVTTRDPVVAEFARAACRSNALAESDPFGNRAIGFVASIADALGALGMAYVPDPNSPFQSTSQVVGAVDTVHYPRETLAQRAGDCDDTTVLLAALVESVGIPTRLVDVPGHVFLLAGVGVHERNRLALGLDEGLYVVEDGQVWIPVETTVLGKGFAEAWRSGAEAYSSWAARGNVSTISVEEAQARYEPAVLPEPGHGPPDVDLPALAERLNRDATTVASWRSEYLAARYGSVEKRLEATPSALNEVAQVYFAAGETSDARAALERALALEPTSAMTRNNLANLDAAEGDVGGAAERYRAALAADSSDAGIWLNLGLVRYANGDSLEADKALAVGLARSGGYEAACQLLGLPYSEETTREGRPKMSAEEARQLLKSAARGVPIVRGGTAAGRMPKPASTSARKWSGRAAAARSGSDETMSIRDLLYWKGSR